MKNLRLTLDGVEIDLERAPKIPISYSIADVKKLDKRKRSLSKTIKLPGTANNLRFFYSAYSLSVDYNEEISVAYNPTIRVEAELYEDDKLIFKGLFQITKVVRLGEVYEVYGVLYSNFLNIYEELGDLTLSGLGWNEYDHTLNRTNVANSWNTSVILNGVATSNFVGNAVQGYIPSGWGYHYGLIDWGLAVNRNIAGLPADHYDTTPVTNPYPMWLVNELVPLVYVHEVINKIFDYLGLTYTSSYIDSSHFKRLLLSWASGQYPNIPSAETSARQCLLTSNAAAATGIDKSFASVAANPNAYFNPDTLQYEYGAAEIGLTLKGTSYILKDDVFTLASSTDARNQYDATIGKVTINKTGKYRITLTGTLDFDLTVSAGEASEREPGRATLYLVTAKGNRTVADVNFSNLSGDNPAGATDSKSVALNETYDFDLQEGDEVALVLNGRAQYAVNTTTLGAALGITVENANAFNFDLTSIDTVLTTGSTVNVASFLPDMKARDFLDGIIKLSNLYISDVDRDGNVNIEPLEDYYGAQEDAKDYTAKLDVSKPIEIIPASTIEGKTYTFNFSEETDYLSQKFKNEYRANYGSRIFEVPSTWQKGEVKVTLPFATVIPEDKTDSQGSGYNFYLPRIVDKDNETQISTPYSGAARIMYYTSGNTVANSGNIRLRETGAGAATTDYTIAYAPSHLSETKGTVTLTGQRDLLFSEPKAIYFTPAQYTTPNGNQYQYYKKFIQELTGAESKIVRAYFNLDNEDLATMDFAQLWLVDGILYRLNEIVNYSPLEDRSTLVELLKITPRPIGSVTGTTPPTIPPTEEPEV